MPPIKTVLLIATLDTKGEEAAFLRKSIESQGKKVLVLDTGSRGEPNHCFPEFDRCQVAAAGGTTYLKLLRMPRHQAVEVMTVGTANLLRRQHAIGSFDGVLALGGFDGSLIASRAMQVLPLGLPKLLVSAMACGGIRFGEYVGTKDITVMPSVTDLLGLNEITSKMLANAAGAICGMVDAATTAAVRAKNLVAATVFGQTTPAGMAGKAQFESAGFQLVAFHPNGVGGAAMEELLRQKAFCGVWDLTLQEISDFVVNGTETGAHRLEAAGKRGIPQVIVPGCVDFIWGPPEVMRREFPKRHQHLFNRSVLLVKLTRSEIKQTAQLIASRLNRSRGPVVVVLPERGLSMFDFPGGPFVEPGLLVAFFGELKIKLNRKIPLVEIDAHINDPVVASTCASRLIKLISQPLVDKKAKRLLKRSYPHISRVSNLQLKQVL